VRLPLLPVLGALVVATSAVGATSAPAQAATSARVIRWKDGDSLLTTAGEVRLIGVDTPERGTCGAAAAKARAERLAPAGSRIRLANPASVQDEDRYGRKLRYLVSRRVDVGLNQIRHGAKARYDGRDGYDRHPRQASYRRADRKHADYRCGRNGSQPASSGTGSAYAPVSLHDCPSYAPIKGNQGSNGWIYHQPGQQYYAVTNPEQCFKSAADAEAAGYRASKV
jgi:endonuclease YncB( thermonuclease family)